MSNRSPKTLWPIDYSSMTSITHRCNWLPIDVIDYSLTIILCRKTHSLPSCTPFCVCDSFICVIRSFLYNWHSCWRNYPFAKGQITLIWHVEKWSAYHKYRWFLIVQYFTLLNSLFNNKTTEQETTSLKMKLTSTLKRINCFYLVLIRQILFSAMIWYWWVMNEINDWSMQSMTNRCNRWLNDNQIFCGLSISHRLLIDHRQ